VSGPALLETDDLTRAYGSLLAVSRANVATHKGELRSIIGPNGAGKTTFCTLISGEVRPTSGHIRFNGRDIAGLSQHEVCRLGITQSYQLTNIFPRLTVLEKRAGGLPGLCALVQLLVARRSAHRGARPRARHPRDHRAGHLEVALGLSRRLYVMDQGRIQFEGTPETLRADPAIQQRFPGV